HRDVVGVEPDHEVDLRGLEALPVANDVATGEKVVRAEQHGPGAGELRTAGADAPAMAVDPGPVAGAPGVVAVVEAIDLGVPVAHLDGAGHPARGLVVGDADALLDDAALALLPGLADRIEVLEAEVDLGLAVGELDPVVLAAAIGDPLPARL